MAIIICFDRPWWLTRSAIQILKIAVSALLPPDRCMQLGLTKGYLAVAFDEGVKYVHVLEPCFNLGIISIKNDNVTEYFTWQRNDIG